MRLRTLFFGLAAVAVAAPFFAVTFPPVADLPQHMAQVRLFGEAMQVASPYRVQWATPYSLVYLPLAAAGKAVGPLAGARLAMALLAVLWIGALHLLAARFRRPPEAALAASVLVFHHALYWGFLPFLLGFPAFALWLLLVRSEPTPQDGRWGRRGALFAGAALLLYFSHALWLAAGLAWLALDSVLRLARRALPWRALAARLAGAGTVAALAAWWFGSIAGTSFATPPLWLADAWRRLTPSAWVEAAFGGLQGPLEPVALAALAAWLLAAWLGWRNRPHAVHAPQRGVAGDAAGDPADGWDPYLALVAALFMAAALLLPDKYTNTIEFNDRWLAPGLALLLLAVPRLRLRPAVVRFAAVALLATFVTVTALTWRHAEAEELAGLPAALAALPDQPRLLGLDFLRGSRYFDRQPYLQTFAWGQVLHGGELNFSFAEFPPSPVVYQPPREAPWTPGLEWFPQAVRAGDFGYFDDVLVRAGDEIHAQFAAAPFLTPLSPEPTSEPTPWRLYRVEPGAPRSPFRAAPDAESADPAAE